MILNAVKITSGSHLEHVIIGSGVTLGNDVSFGMGVRYQSQLACRGNAYTINASGEVAEPAETSSCFEIADAMMIVTPSSADRGITADLVLVAVSLSTAEVFTYDGKNWVSIEPELDAILTLLPYQALPLTVELPINDLMTLEQEPDAVIYYFGYRLADGSFTYAPFQ